MYTIQVNRAREKVTEEKEEYDEEYFTDEEEEDQGDLDDDAASSLVEIPSAFMSRYQNEQLKRRRQGAARKPK